MPDFVIVCPGCKKQLHVPPEAVDGPAHCPHCKTNFRLPANPDGSPGVPVVTRRPGYVIRLPGPLIFPAFALIVLGLIGTLVNLYMSVQFTFRPGSDLEYARLLVAEQRAQKALYTIGNREEDWEPAPHAAVAGPAATLAMDDVQDERLAATWAENLAPLHYASTIASLLSLLGGIAIVRGRYYPLALLGCLAAILNFNHFCCVPGAVAGIWGILALIRDDVKPHFR